MERQLEFFQLIAEGQQAGGAQAIDEQRAVEVIGFVLNNAGHEAIDLAADFIAGQIVRLNLDLGISDHGCANSRDAQAALFVFFLAVTAAEHRVDEHLFEFPGVGVALFVGDEQPIGQIDLVRCQADALVLVHQLDHFIDDFSQFRIDSLQGLRAVPERRVRILNDLKTQSSSKGLN